MKKEEFLKENGFKKIEFRDKSSYWWEKKFKLGEFNVKFYYDVTNACDIKNTCVQSLIYASLEGKTGYYIPLHSMFQLMIFII